MQPEINAKAECEQVLTKIKSIQTEYQHVDSKLFAAEIKECFRVISGDHAESDDFKEKLAQLPLGVFVLSMRTIINNNLPEIHKGIAYTKKIIELTENKSTPFEKALRLTSIEVATAAYLALSAINPLLPNKNEQDKARIMRETENYFNLSNSFKSLLREETLQIKEDQEMAKVNEASLWIEAFFAAFLEKKDKESAERYPTSRYIV
jgi:hypothetical protein